MENRIKRKIYLLIFSVIAFFIILILVKLLFFINSNLYYAYPPNIRLNFNINSSLSPGIYNNSIVSTNKYGYRGTEVNQHSRENEYRILAIGGSTTIDVLLDDKESWTYLLEKNLNMTNDGRRVVIINVGKLGHRSYEHIIYLKSYYEQFNPDLVIILMGVNDVGSYFSKKQDFYPENKILFFSSPYNSKKEKLNQYIETLRIKFNKNSYQKRLDDHYKNLLKRIIINDYKNPPEISYGLNNYENNIRQLINFSEQKKIKIIFMTQPTLLKENYSEDELMFMGFYKSNDGIGYELPVMKYFMEEYNKELLEECERNKNDYLIYCFDLDNKIPKNISYFYDGAHFNENGAIKVADEISNFIKMDKDILKNKR